MSRWIIKDDRPGARRDLLMYNKKYHLWLKGKYKGIATLKDDPHHGDVFLERVVENGEPTDLVYMADEWELVNESESKPREISVPAQKTSGKKAYLGDD